MDSAQKKQTTAKQGFAAGMVFGALTVLLLLGGAFSSLGTAPDKAAGSRERRAISVSSDTGSQVLEAGEANAERDVLDLQLD
jgi:hypothetical protein